VSTLTPAARISRPLSAMRRRPVLAVGVLIALLAALLLGGAVGRVTAPPAVVDGAAAVERDIVPLSVDADGLWAAGAGPLPAIGEQLAALRRDDRTDAIVEHAAGWDDAYETVLRRMVGVEVPAPARPVQRQFVTAVTMSRDALEVLAAAAATEDPALRRELSSEALRLRTRSEQMTQTARASLADLRGGTQTGVAEPAPLPRLDELR
jgi:hypothetical protein